MVSETRSWSGNNVDVCVLPEMQTVFPDTADEMNGMEIKEFSLHNYSHLKMF